MEDMIARLVCAETEALPELRRFSLDEYFRMVDAGILMKGTNVELLEGLIFDMVPISSWHAACVNLLNEILVTRLTKRAMVGVRSTIRLANNLAPDPDIVMLRPKEDHYRAAHAGPGDVLLLIEVSHGTLRFDRDVKLPLYARAGIPEVWIVDVERRRVLVYRKPSADGYEQSFTVRGDELLAPEAFPDVALNVSEFLALPAPQQTKPKTS